MSSTSVPFEGPIGLLHPGEMGAAVGAALVQDGHQVLWASCGRSDLSRQRAAAAGLEDVGSVADLANNSGLVVSICPPSNAYEVAKLACTPATVYVDANAISPRTSKMIASLIETNGGSYVDGSIIGRPPSRKGDVRLYLSGTLAPAVSALFLPTIIGTFVLGEEVGTASALKMAYAGWSKGKLALLLAIREYSSATGVDPALLEEWSTSMPSAEAEYAEAARLAGTKGWRWVGEMDEIATAFCDAGVPDGFFSGSSDIFLSRSRAAS